MTHRRCPKCNATMEIGFLVDTTRNAARVARWAAGEPSFGFFGLLRMRGRKTLPVESWRCGKCGLLETVAAADGA